MWRVQKYLDMRVLCLQNIMALENGQTPLGKHDGRVVWTPQQQRSQHTIEKPYKQSDSLEQRGAASRDSRMLYWGETFKKSLTVFSADRLE